MIVPNKIIRSNAFSWHIRRSVTMSVLRVERRSPVRGQTDANDLQRTSTWIPSSSQLAEGYNLARPPS
jgi:hypothetical protein